MDEKNFKEFLCYCMSKVEFEPITLVKLEETNVISSKRSEFFILISEKTGTPLFLLR